MLKFICIIIILFSVFSYMYFFCRYGIDVDDEGLHLYVSNLILKGFVPYRDFILHVTPVSYYLQAFIFRIFSPSVMVGRVTVVFLGFYMAILLYKISKSIVRSDYFAAIAGILFIFWGVTQIRHPWYGWYGLASGLTFAYLVLKYLRFKGSIYLFFSGFFCGATFLMKQNLGVACLAAYISFLVVSLIFSDNNAKEKFTEFFKKQFIFIIGIASILGPVIFYFSAQKTLPAFLYYVFRFAADSAGGRFIFNPFPHVRSVSLIIILIYLLFSWFLYKCFWAHSYKRKVFLFLTTVLIGVFILGMILFIVRINEIDRIYILDRIKMGSVNVFFNLAMAAVGFGGFIILKRAFKKRYIDEWGGRLLFVVLFSFFYIWASLCISRDHLHLVLGMPPSYILLSCMFYRTAQKLRDFIVRKNKDVVAAGRYANLTVCVFPLIFMSYFGFFTALKNEGFRSVFPPVTRMRSELRLDRARGIMVAEEDRDAIEGVTRYIESNTSAWERIFDTYKNSLFYFLSDRVHPSFYYILHPDLFRPDKQDDVIKDIVRDNIKLAITGKDLWDDLDKYADDKANPLTFKILRYMRDNFKISGQFGEYYILTKPR